jgi:hypothetical protein
LRLQSDEELVAIKDRAAEQLMRLPGVNGVGIGGRVRGGKPTGEVVLKVFVGEKKPLSDLAPGEVVPPQFEGVPTDVVVMGILERDIKEPPGREPVPDNEIDDDRKRPLIGGTMLQVDLSGAGAGTLGCFLQQVGDNTKVYALTAYHVLSTDTRAPVIGTTKAGQAYARDSSTKCCSAIIGVFSGGSKVPLRDAGIVQLAPGSQYLADILELGAVTGKHDITVTEAATHTYPVRKRGIRTLVTGGTVQAINATIPIDGVTHTNLTVVLPNPDATLKAGTQVFFSQPGDSGSAYVNDAMEVVAVHMARDPANNKQSVGTPIGAVISQFQTVEKLSLAVVTASQPGQVQTVPGTAMVAVPPEVRAALGTAHDAVPAAAPGHDAVAAAVTVPARIPVGGWLPQTGPPPAAVLANLQRDLDRSGAGRMFISAWLRHQDELVELVYTNKRVAMVWHRSGGSALSQYLVRMLSQPSLAMPEQVNGQPLAHCLDRLQEVFCRYGSAQLRRDLTRVRAALPDMSGRAYPQIVAALSGA